MKEDFTDTAPLMEKGLLNLLATLSYLTYCFVVQNIYKQTMRHACYVVFFPPNMSIYRQATCTQRR